MKITLNKNLTLRWKPTDSRYSIIANQEISVPEDVGQYLQMNYLDSIVNITQEEEKIKIVRPIVSTIPEEQPKIEEKINNPIQETKEEPKIPIIKPEKNEQQKKKDFEQDNVTKKRNAMSDLVITKEKRFSDVNDVLTEALNLGIIIQDGTSFKYEGEHLCQGKNKLKQKILNEHVLLEELRQTIKLVRG